MIPLAEKYTGTVMDILPGILFWAGVLLGTFFMVIPGWIMLISMWITLVSFYGHFVFNGRVYKFLHIKRVLQTKEKAEHKQETLQHAKEGV